MSTTAGSTGSQDRVCKPIPEAILTFINDINRNRATFHYPEPLTVCPRGLRIKTRETKGGGMRKILVAVGAALFLTQFIVAQDQPQGEGKPEGRVADDPEQARIVTSDIALFWQEYDSAASTGLESSMDDYLKKGSYGLQQFTRLRIRSAANLAQVIRTHPKYYASIRPSTLRIDSMSGSIRAAFRNLKRLYPDAVFPDVYFMIGSMNSGGTTTDRALLIGAEMYGKTNLAPPEELDDWLKRVLKPVEEIPGIVAHELIHYQQKYTVVNRSLLAQAIKEGSADFVGELIVGKSINDHLRAYGDPNERELWLEFKQQMDDKDTSRWLYQGDKSKDRPADLGYYIGYKICESYYRHASDRAKAIKDILGIQDFKQFLQASQYDSKFA